MVASFGRSNAVPSSYVWHALASRPTAGHEALCQSGFLRIRNTITRVFIGTCKREPAGSSFPQQKNQIQPWHRVAIEADFRTNTRPMRPIGQPLELPLYTIVRPTLACPPGTSGRGSVCDYLSPIRHVTFGAIWLGLRKPAAGPSVCPEVQRTIGESTVAVSRFSNC